MILELDVYMGQECAEVARMRILLALWDVTDFAGEPGATARTRDYGWLAGWPADRVQAKKHLEMITA